MTDRQYVRDTLRDMLIHYNKNMGNPSKYTGDIITPKMISRVTERYLELGGKLNELYYADRGSDATNSTREEL